MDFRAELNMMECAERLENRLYVEMSQKQIMKLQTPTMGFGINYQTNEHNKIQLHVHSTKLTQILKKTQKRENNTCKSSITGTSEN